MRRVAAPGDDGSHTNAPCCHQRPADHAGGRRLSKPERDLAAGVGLVRLHPARALLYGHALTGQASREGGRGDLPGKYGGRVRGDRVAPGVGRSEKGDRLSEPGDGNPNFRRLRNRDQTHQHPRNQTLGSKGHPIRHRARARQCDADAQRQHYEIHGGCVQGLGIRSGPGGIRRSDLE